MATIILTGFPYNASGRTFLSWRMEPGNHGSHKFLIQFRNLGIPGDESLNLGFDVIFLFQSLKSSESRLGFSNGGFELPKSRILRFAGDLKQVQS